jgi:hypoxanthine-DNA glycosylase
MVENGDTIESGIRNERPTSFPPIFDRNSETLILGTFPSVQSRASGFYYAHPRNRFWPVLSNILTPDAATPSDINEKKRLILDNGLALWDVLDSCDIMGSSDASIKNETPNDIKSILAQSSIRRALLNGAKAGELYRRHIKPVLPDLPFSVLNSTSPANAAFSLEKLTDIWRVALRP